MRHNRRDGGEWPASSGRRCNDLPRPILFFVAAKENGSACSSGGDNELPRPILLFVAAKENGSACSSRIGNEFPRLILILNRGLIVKRTAGQFPAVLILYDAIEALG